MSSSAQAPVPTQPPRVPEHVFLGVAWGSAAVTFIFVCIRLAARMRLFKRLYIDDAFVVLAWLINLSTAIMWQTVAHKMYTFLAVVSGTAKDPPPASLVPDTEHYLKVSVSAIVFFYTNLWLIKVAFLIFFRRLSDKVTGQRVLWLVVAIFSGAAYFVCIGDIEYNCLVSDLAWISEHCAGSYAINFQQVTLKVNCALDVATDYMIMSVPFNMLRKAQISLPKKLALFGIFSLTVLVTVFAIIRVALVSTLTKQPDMTWLYMWSMIEQGVAILVACAASFPQLFRSGNKPSRYHEKAAQRSILESGRDKIKNLRKEKQRPSDISLILRETDEYQTEPQPQQQNTSSSQVSFQCQDVEHVQSETKMSAV